MCRMVFPRLEIEQIALQSFSYHVEVGLATLSPICPHNFGHTVLTQSRVSFSRSFIEPCINNMVLKGSLSAYRPQVP